MPARTFDVEAPSGAVRLTVLEDATDLVDAWDALAADHAETVYANRRFMEPWARHVGSRAGLVPRYVLGERNGRAIAFIPLALGREGGIPMLLALSDSHTNLNGGLFDPSWDVAPAALHAALFELEPQAEGLWVCCVAAPEGRHPLLARPCPSVHDAYGGTFDGGFEGHLSRNNARRKRKKHRTAARKLDAAGAWSVRRVVDEAQALSLLDEAFGLFAERFGREGIADPFAEPGVRDWMAEMLSASLHDARPAMALWTLEADGVPVAIQAGGGAGGNFSLMFTVYRPGPLDPVGPGDFLLHEVIEAAAEAGYRSFDLGRGREPYKTSWCDVTIPLHDVRVARSARAKLYFAAHAGVATLKKRVRASDRLWDLAKGVRRRLPVA